MLNINSRICFCNHCFHMLPMKLKTDSEFLRVEKHTDKKYFKKSIKIAMIFRFKLTFHLIVLIFPHFINAAFSPKQNKNYMFRSYYTISFNT